MSSLESLHRLSLALGSTLDLAHECNVFVDWLGAEIQPRLIALSVAEAGQNSLCLLASQGVKEPPAQSMPVGTDPWDWLKGSKARLPRGARYLLPVGVQGGTFGLLAVISAREGKDLVEERRLLDLAIACLAPILRNIEHHKDVGRLVEERTTQLRASEERYRDLVENSRELICTHDLEGCILSANPAGARMLGYEVEDAPGHNIRDILAPSVRGQFDDYITTLRQKGTASGLMLVQTRSGELRLWEYNNSLRTEGVPRPIVRGIARDVTDRIRAEQALRESEEKFRLLVENAVEVFYQFAVEKDFLRGKVIFISPQAQTLTGHAAEEFVRDPSLWVVSIHPDDLPQVIENTQTLLFQKAPVAREYRIWNAEQKEYRWVGDRITPRFDDQGNVIGYQGIARDITSRKQEEEARWEAERRYRALFEQSHDAIFILDLQGRHLAANQRAADMLGYSMEELLGLSFRDTSVQLPESQQVMERLLGGEPIPLYERVFRKKNGDLFPVEINAELIRDANGNPLHIQSVVRDITERKRAEENLRESEERFRLLAESSLTGFYLIQDGRFRYVNSALAQAFGYCPDEVIGQLDPLDMTHPSDRPRVRENIRRRVEGEVEDIHYEFCGLRKDGSTLDVEVHGRRIVFEGRPGVIGTLIDITERKRHERELEAEAMFAQALGETLELQPLLKRLLEAACHAIPTAGKGSLALRTDEKHLQVLAITGYQESSVLGFTYPITWGYVGRAVQQRSPLLMADIRADPELFEDARNAAIPEVRDLRSAVAVPLLVHETVIGVLSLESDQPGVFNEDDLRLLANFGASAALIIERSRLFEETRRHADEFAALHDTARDLAAQHHLPTLLNTIAERARNLLHAPGGGVYLYDAERGDLEMVLAVGAQPLPSGTRLQMGKGMAGRVGQTRQPLIVDDYRTWEGRASQYAAVPFRAVAQAPMLYAGELIGVLVVHELGESERKFTEADIHLLSLFAEYAAGAVNVARLLQETRRRAEETAALLEASLALNSLDLDTILQTVGEHTQTLFAADGCRIFLLEPGGETLRCIFVLQENQEAFLDLTVQLNEGVTGAVAATGQAEIVNDMLHDPRAVQVPGTEEEPEAIMFAPLKERGQTIGVISIRRIGADRPFHPPDLELLRAFASMAASAVSNARLFVDTQKRLAELGVLHQSSQNLLVSGFDPAATYASIHEAVKRVMPSDTFVIVLEDEEGGDYHAVYRNDKGMQYPPVRVPRGQGLSGQVISGGQTLLIGDHCAHNDIPALHFGRPEHVRSVLAVPLQRGDHTFGMISAQSYQPNVYNEGHRAVLETLAAQFASSIENARLFAETQLRLRELETLQSVSAAMRHARIVQEMLPIFVKYASQSVGANSGSIFLLEESSGDWVSQGWTTAKGDWLPASSDLRHRPGEGVTGHVGASGEIYIAADWRTDPFTRALPGEVDYMEVLQCSISLPLNAEERVIGVMHLWFADQHTFTEAEQRLLTAIADMAGNALQRARLHEETLHRVEQLQALQAIDQAITASLDPRVSLNILLERTIRQLQVDAAGVLLLNPLLHTLEYAAGRGFRSRAYERSASRLGEGQAGRAALERCTVTVTNLSEVHFMRNDLLREEGFVSYLAAPLIAKGLVKGVLEVFQRVPLSPSADQLSFFESLAQQAAIAVDNSQLFESLQRSNMELSLAYEKTIEGWSHALDLRDEETEGHTQRVTELTLQLARAMGQTEEQIIHIRRGAFLHDIGKMGVPDRILFKSGPLTDEEWAVMHRHPQFAYDMLSPIEYLHPALDIPYCHHEKWDGTGYPRGLKGEQIPLAARIFAVVDVWDALRSVRPYRSPWTAKQTRAYIVEQSGKHFDPQVVEAFLRLIENE